MTQRDTLKLDPESMQLLKVYYIQFVHAGANLSDADKDEAARDQQAGRVAGDRFPAEAARRHQGRRAGRSTTRPSSRA